MAWSFPAEFTEGEQIFGRNVAISPGDTEFVSRLYPYPTVGAASTPVPVATPKTARGAANKAARGAESLIGAGAHFERHPPLRPFQRFARRPDLG